MPRRILPYLLPIALLSGCLVPAAERDPVGTVAFAMRSTLAPGAEAHVCQYVRMPDAPGELFVRGGAHELSDGTHHYLLYRTRITAWRDELAEPVPCDEHGEVMRSATTYVTGGQERRANADFPAGAALSFAPGEILLLQGHFLNASAAPREAKVDLVLRTVPESAVEHRAGVLRFYNPFIHVPPRGRAQAGMTCTIKKDVTLLSAASHMHRRGVAFEAFLDPPGGPPSEAPFYTSPEWDHPDVFLGSLRIPAGSKVRFRCHYENPDPVAVVQGVTADGDEMCMLSAFYFPAMDPADEDCADMHGHGTGALSCAETTSCLEACPVSEAPDFASGDPRVGACFQRCVTSSCPDVTAALFPQLTCTARECAAECAEMGDVCRACVVARCASEVSACQGLAPCAP